MIKELFTVLVLTSSYLSDGILVMPPSSPTIHQLTIGLGVPLNLKHEAVVYGWTIKTHYYLPESTAQQLKWSYFRGVWKNYDAMHLETKLKPFPYGGRRKREEFTDKMFDQKYESNNVEVEETRSVQLKKDALYDEVDELFDDHIDNQGNIPKLSDYPLKTEKELMDMSGIRWLLYDGFGRMLNIKGLDGRYCVLRSICEAAESNFGFHNGIFGQLFHLFFTPSSTSDVIVNREHYDYLKAEMLGEAGEPCDQIFHQCKKSILEIFTKVYDLDFRDLN
ncbi:hypothetical protein ACKWTF_011057 [Chironomus riparius]